jgi:signal transduction histidine kinase
MKRGSLKFRLLAAAAASIALALAIAGVGLLLLFERHVERRMALELESHLRQLASGLGRGADGSLELAHALAEPRFLEPLSGLYWQIAEEPAGTVLRSRSLWDAELSLSRDHLADADVHRHVVAGPGGSRLLVVERAIAMPANLGGGKVRVAVAIERSEIHAAGRAFAADLAPSLALVALVLIGAAGAQVAIGLRPLDAVRRRLHDVSVGRERRLGESFPDEVLPLAAEVDRLLDAQDAAIDRARARAADLAHGLKTPLAVLASDAAELRSRGEVAVADEIAALAEGMTRHVERELARARAGARVRGRALQLMRPVAEQVVGVLRRTPRGERIDWRIRMPEDLAAPVDPQDLAELLGNLAENAAKWAASQVRIEGDRAGGEVTLRVEDDGPGLADEQIATALARGERLDRTQPGSGLGLAIVADLADAYGAALSLKRSSLGGLGAEIRFRRPRQGPAS